MVVQAEVGWEHTPQLLMMGMYQPPESAFAKRYSEQTIRFPCTMADLYSDIKSTSTWYSAGIEAYRAKKEYTISLESPRSFELSIGATMDELLLLS